VTFSFALRVAISFYLRKPRPEEHLARIEVPTIDNLNIALNKYISLRVPTKNTPNHLSKGGDKKAHLRA